MAKAMPITRMAGRVLVVILHFAQVILTLGAIGILFTRSSFVAFSTNLYGASAPLMNSPWLDLLMRPLLALPVLLLAGAFVYLRSNMVSQRQKLAADVAYAGALAGWISLLLLGLYGPVLAN